MRPTGPLHETDRTAAAAGCIRQEELPSRQVRWKPSSAKNPHIYIRVLLCFLCLRAHSFCTVE
jgi:hypothetical protein